MIKWYKGATAIGGATNQIYYATTTANYKVNVTNTFGCAKTSSIYAIIRTCRLIDEASLITKEELLIYPQSSKWSIYI